MSALSASALAEWSISFGVSPGYYGSNVYYQQAPVVYPPVVYGQPYGYGYGYAAPAYNSYPVYGQPAPVVRYTYSNYHHNYRPPVHHDYHRSNHGRHGNRGYNGR